MCLLEMINPALPDLSNTHYQSIEDLVITQEGVIKQLQQLNVNKASGPDEIPVRILKDYADDLAPILNHIFTQSYKNGILPRDWLSARVVGIYKKGQKSDPANYRPVSLTCICCKIMEHIVLGHIAKHLAANDIVIDNQHGFRERLSCETQLLEAINDFALNVNNSCQTDILFLDFSKAFDKVSHHKLLHNIDFYGIRGHTKKWIHGFVSDRMQQVSVNGKKSKVAKVLSGVPRGSVLGPVLFLLYINDITDGVKSTMRLFADDSMVYRCIRNRADQISLHKDLQKVFEWAETWGMIFNVEKCTHLTITLKENPLQYDYFIDGKKIPQESSCKYLGITISKDLSWNLHAEYVR